MEKVEHKLIKVIVSLCLIISGCRKFRIYVASDYSRIFDILGIVIFAVNRIENHFMPHLHKLFREFSRAKRSRPLCGICMI